MAACSHSCAAILTHSLFLNTCMHTYIQAWRPARILAQLSWLIHSSSKITRTGVCVSCPWSLKSYVYVYVYILWMYVSMHMRVRSQGQVSVCLAPGAWCGVCNVNIWMYTYTHEHISKVVRMGVCLSCPWSFDPYILLYVLICVCKNTFVCIHVP